MKASQPTSIVGTPTPTPTFSQFPTNTASPSPETGPWIYTLQTIALSFVLFLTLSATIRAYLHRRAERNKPTGAKSILKRRRANSDPGARASGEDKSSTCSSKGKKVRWGDEKWNAGKGEGLSVVRILDDDWGQDVGSGMRLEEELRVYCSLSMPVGESYEDIEDF